MRRGRSTKTSGSRAISHGLFYNRCHPTTSTDRLKSEALRLGFDDVGIAPAVSPPGYPDFLRWLEAGHAAGMELS